MILRPGLKTGLKIAYKDPKEVGSDRIADAMGAIKLFPDRNLIVVDFGTATTVCAITKDRVFLGAISCLDSISHGSSGGQNRQTSFGRD